MMASGGIKWALRLVVVMCGLTGVIVSGTSYCPTVCACKWKGGKQTVECVDRVLITIPANVPTETQVLDMSGNNLQILPKDMFIRATLLDLQKVYLKSCRIGQIDEHALNGLTNLVELDLSYNLLTSIPSSTFHDVPLLREIILANNPIQKIESNAFRTAPSLVKLDLSNCELQLIAPKAFEGVEQLESLKLNGNRLTELRPRTVNSLKRLNGIELHNNPWLCDCRLREVKIWLQENNIPYPVAPVCRGGPERVVDKTFADLEVDDFACKPEILPMNRYVEAVTGENATIICRVGAVPPATLHWYWNTRLLLNNSAISSHQRVYMFVDGHFERSSTLVLTNAQETDSSEFYCVAENRAGHAEANFTLHVSLRTAGMATLGSGQIAGLSAALVVLILFILFIILVLLVRLKRLPFSESKLPAQVETVVNNSDANTNNTCKTSSFHPAQHSDTSFTEHDKVVTNELKVACNPIQKPPRLTELAYSTSHYDSKESVINNVPLTGSALRPTATANNPDLIKDTKRLMAGDLKLNGYAITQIHEESIELRPGSGEYSREGCDSLYPSGLWEQQPACTTPELFLRRTTSTSFNYDANDKTPIMADTQGMDGLEDEDYCRMLPSQVNGGYPPDFGLPIMPSGVDRKLREVGAVNGAASPSTSPTSTNLPSEKTLRVWQRGVPVLPPVTALKRVLSRNSPDEGYQEGCGTDV